MSKVNHRFPNLLEPEMLPAERFRRLTTGESMRDTLQNRAAELGHLAVNELPALVVVQEPPAFQKLPGNTVGHIIKTAQSVRSQMYDTSIQVAAVLDKDRFKPSEAQHDELTRLGVTVIPATADATSSNAFNTSHKLFEGVRDRRGLDPYGLVVPMTAGSRFATDQALRAAAMHVGEGSHAIFGPLLNGATHPNTLGRSIFNGDGEFYDVYPNTTSHPSRESYGYMSNSGCALGAAMLRESVGVDPSDSRAIAFRNWAVDRERSACPVVYDNALAIHDPRSASVLPAELAAEADLFGPSK